MYHSNDPISQRKFSSSLLLYLMKAHAYVNMANTCYRAHTWKLEDMSGKSIVSFYHRLKGLNSGCQACVASSFICGVTSFASGFLYSLLVLFLRQHTWEIDLKRERIFLTVGGGSSPAWWGSDDGRAMRHLAMFYLQLQSDRAM